MHIREAFRSLIENCMQIGAAVVIILLQRWLLELSTFEKDVRWLKRQTVYGWLVRARWYRGQEVYPVERTQDLLCPRKLRIS